MEAYAVFFFGSRAFLRRAAAFHQERGVDLLDTAREWRDYLTALVVRSLGEAGENPFHRRCLPNRRRHYGALYPYSALRRELDDQHEGASEACAPPPDGDEEPADAALRRLRLAQYLKTCEEHNRHCYPCWALYNNNQMVSAKYFNLINCMQ